MEFCSLEGPGHLTVHADEVSLRLVLFFAPEILLLKFGLAFWNCDLEL